MSGLLKIRPAQASRRVKLAKDLDSSLVLTQTLLNAGEINVEQADVIAQTASSSADTTTDSSTKAPGRSAPQSTATPHSSHPTGSTPTETPNATTDSAYNG
ncbi:DUF222 domain-containing protein [Actinopolymorpha sp. B17G11]|uniref:DUF222 domain-containing protein n=1 Tax=Actinopolymorpha sp. B17G11 TaxID=3160861 RepID=UPI0032E4F624